MQFVFIRILDYIWKKFENFIWKGIYEEVKILILGYRLDLEY